MDTRKRNTLNGRTRGAIVGLALFVGVLTGGLWLGSPAGDTHVAPDAAGCTVFAGRGGSLPCSNPYSNTHDSQVARKVVGTTFTGCALGLAAGGPAGAYFGCLGGLFSNIPW